MITKQSSVRKSENHKVRTTPTNLLLFQSVFSDVILKLSVLILNIVIKGRVSNHNIYYWLDKASAASYGLCMMRGLTHI